MAWKYKRLLRHRLWALRSDLSEDKSITNIIWMNNSEVICKVIWGGFAFGVFFLVFSHHPGLSKLTPIVHYLMWILQNNPLGEVHKSKSFSLFCLTDNKQIIRFVLHRVLPYLRRLVRSSIKSVSSSVGLEEPFLFVTFWRKAGFLKRLQKWGEKFYFLSEFGVYSCHVSQNLPTHLFGMAE